jgi:hypothetical protein
MSNQIVISSGAKVRNLNGVLTGTAGVVDALGINVPSGIPQLDGSGKILVSQLPNSVMEYKGTWNAATNTPTLVNGTGNQGDVYLVSVAGTVNFGAGPITFAVGDQVIYSGSIWQKAGGSTGTVTSVAVTESGDALTITGSPITTSGTINIGFAGTSGQYVNGAGGLTTFPTLLSSVGLSMPSAFNVANSPLTANGTIAVTGAGVASQYIRGDGTLANFPTSGGGGSSVSYYLNGSINQGTIGGVTYYEMNKVPVIGAGTDFSRGSNGYIASFLTDANDPALLEIPAGNWNFETYFNASNGGGSPTFYIELYKYDGTTFTLIASNSAFPKLINDGTSIEAYFSALAVPQTSLTSTDRLAVRIYVTTAGRTITLHTENSHLCQVITTFSTGITAINGLTAQVQFLATGTSGTDFNISSSTATHTFNLPVASASNTGKLSSTDWSTFNSKQNTITLTTTGTSGVATLVGATLNIPNYGSALSGYLPLTGGTMTGQIVLKESSSSTDFTKGLRFPNDPFGGSGDISGLRLYSSSAENQILELYIGNDTTSPSDDKINFATGVGGIANNDYVTINGNKIWNAGNLANPISGTGNTNYIPKFTASGTIGNSIIFDNGNIGIATTNTGNFSGVGFTGPFLDVAGILQIKGTSANGVAIIQLGGDTFRKATIETSIGTQTPFLAFGTASSGSSSANSERMRITNTGRVGIGQTAPGVQLSVAGQSDTWQFAVTTATGTAGALIGSPSANVLAFGDWSGTERMRITSGGAVYINGTAGSIWTSSSASIAQISINDTFPLIIAKNDNLCTILNRTNSNGVILEFKYNGSTVGSISTNSNSLPSDFNFKKDITDLSLGLNLVSKLRPVHYRHKMDEHNEALSNGIIAQELEQALLDCGVEKNSLLMLQHKPNEKENESQYWVDYTKMIPVLIKSIQEQQAQIEELKAMIAAK